MDRPQGATKLTIMSSSPPRVLVVDDSHVNLELARAVLEAGGFEVDTALDAARAREAVTRSLPDIVLMDIQLPDVDGLQLMTEFKADPRMHGIPIVAFTAYAMRGDEARFRAAGCDAYLSKPIEVATFAASVRALLAAG